MRKSSIPLFAGVAGIGGLVMTAGGCNSDRSLDPGDFLGIWNAVQQRSTDYYGQPYTYDMPRLYVQNYGGMTYCSGFFFDLELRSGGAGTMTYGYTDYGSCDPSMIYSYGYDIEWEDMGNGKVGIFGEGDSGVTSGYVEEGSYSGSGLSTFTETGSYGVTGYGSTGLTAGTSGETGGDSPPDNLPVPLPTRARELLMTCTPGGGRLDCAVPEDSFNIVFGRPECSMDSECNGAGEVCFAQQCVVPQTYDYNGDVGQAPRPRRAAKSLGKIFARTPASEQP